ncbi:MAG: universal stress protein [Weeksellaceae bacterium]|jgi:nucleotide-binding universal stress UspA family protein|nr:universal stress protein [Weeksellaceae bacterium]
MAQKILVPIDLSDINSKVISTAIAQAKLVPDSEIFMVHVVTLDIGIIVSETGFTYLPELEEDVFNDETRQVEELKEMVEKEGIPCKLIVKQGIPSDIILQEAQDLGADLIVIGSQGHNMLYNVFIGSVATEVIKRSQIPLLVVPKNK